MAGKKKKAESTWQLIFLDGVMQWDWGSYQQVCASRNGVVVTRRDNYIFDDGLAVVDSAGGRSTSFFRLVSVNDGQPYYISASEFVTATNLASVSQQEVTFPESSWNDKSKTITKRCLVLACHWTFKKQGSSISLIAVDPEL